MIKKAFRIRALAFLLPAVPYAAYANPAWLWVYSVNLNDLNYVTSSPYVQWTPNTIQTNQANWVVADQFLIVQTNVNYSPACSSNQNNCTGACNSNGDSSCDCNGKNCQPRPGPTCSGGNCWGIQIFTDNTSTANANTNFLLPNYFNSSGQFIPGGSTKGPLTPLYAGSNAFRDTSNDTVIPKGGLVSVDGKQRLPLIWSVYDILPGCNSNSRVCSSVIKPAIAECPNGLCSNGSHCDFLSCNWAYIADKGDLIIKSAAASVQSNWTDLFDYDVPLSQYGGQYTIGTRWKPTGDCMCGNCGQCAPCDTANSGCTTSQYLLFGANFVNGTRQLFKTTIFVELVVG